MKYPGHRDLDGKTCLEKRRIPIAGKPTWSKCPACHQTLAESPPLHLLSFIWKGLRVLLSEPVKWR